MPTGSEPGGTRLRPPARYAQASSLEELLGVVLQEILSKTPFQRVVLAAGCDQHVRAVGEGVPPGETNAFAEALAFGSRPSGSSLVVGAEPVPDAALEALAAMESIALVPAVSAANGFIAVAAVDAPSRHPDLAEVRRVMRSAGPALSTAAELLAMAVKVGEMESLQVRSRSALDALPDPVLVMDAEARILLSNQRAEELLVTDASDSPGRRHAVETNNLFFSAFRARTILERNQPGPPRELLLVDPQDGSDLLCEVFILPLDDFEGSPGSSVFVLRDITDLRHATNALEVQYRRSVAAEHGARRESERLNVIIENAGVPIFVTDRQTNVALMNREAERLLQASRSARRSPRVQDVRANDAKLAGLINDFMIQPRLRQERRLTLVDPDEAREFPAMAVSTKILDDHYEPNAVVTVLHDLTQEVENQHLAQELRKLNTELEERVRSATSELAQRNEQLQRQSAELERASRMKSEFLQTMSHELRTPINAVLGYNSLLREGLFGELTETQDDALQRMRNATQHLLSLINDILDLSRVEAGKIKVSVAEIDLAVFLEDLSASVRPMAAERCLEYRLEVAPDTPRIRTDDTRLRQVLFNLLSNAVKFTESGSVTVRAGPIPPRGGAFLEVVDTGVGIDEDHLETIFEEFTQVDQSATREHGGTGLGLAISRKLIRLMGGRLAVSSEVDTGTTFRVELPLSPPVTWGDTGGAEEEPAEHDTAPAR